MPRTALNKSELLKINRILIENRAFPIIKIGVYERVEMFDDKTHLTRIQFISQNGKQHEFSLVSLTEPKCRKLKEQLEKYFI